MSHLEVADRLLQPVDFYGGIVPLSMPRPLEQVIYVLAQMVEHLAVLLIHGISGLDLLVQLFQQLAKFFVIHSNLHFRMENLSRFSQHYCTA